MNIKNIALAVSSYTSAFLSINAATASDFSVVVLPDTQKYSENYPEIYSAQTQWIADNKGLYDIQFVSHLGDIVEEAATIEQWENAFSSMSILDNANVPYGVVGGNHDFLYPGDYYDPDGVNYLTYFNPERYQNKPWFGGASESGLSSYQIINIDGKDFLFLHILMETPAEELAWAQRILNQYRELPVWVSTHRYLFDWLVLGSGRYSDFNYTFEPLYRHDGMKSEDFFNNFVSANRQIYLVHCGHNHSEYRQNSTNDFDNTVHEVLADFQSGPNGGDGWLRIYRFKPEDNRIEGRTYSPTRNEWDTDSDSQFVLNVNFDDYRGMPAQSQVILQNGHNGYFGTIDTWINEAEKNKEYGNSTELVIDDDTKNSWWGENAGQTLIRFENIMQGPYSPGDAEPTRIPSNAQIVSAELSINLKDDQDNGNTTYRVFPMSVSWSESSTWNSMGNGISIGSETGAEIASFRGDNEPANNALRTVDVTELVREWSQGGDNFGVAMIRDNTNGNDDGITAYSSEAQETILRPKLTINLTYDSMKSSISKVTQVTQKLTASSYEVNEGEEVALRFSANGTSERAPLIFQLEGQSVGYATGQGDIEHYILLEDEGVYRFGGSVKSNEQTLDAGSVAIRVKNLPPRIIDLENNIFAKAGELIELSVKASDPGKLDRLTYQWSVDSDGQINNAASDKAQVSFMRKGKHKVLLKVSDNDGASVSEIVTINIK
ncbi:DNRLRE domain-containing protein [Pleionea sediminis]|uniref:DNRLRE domain-containing protein n=1 Tax=Pleionea sediminis TaxID=2569479 RepID=UPI001185BFFF|nr:DNRLRE domain-containing protein [Pleionea sediminis]